MINKSKKYIIINNYRRIKKIQMLKEEEIEAITEILAKLK